METVLTTGMALFVVARYVSTEDVTKPARDLYADWADKHHPIFSWFHDLITCCVCTAFWLSVAWGIAVYGAPWDWGTSTWVAVLAPNAVVYLGQFADIASDKS